MVDDVAGVDDPDVATVVVVVLPPAVEPVLTVVVVAAPEEPAGTLPDGTPGAADVDGPPLDDTTVVVVADPVVVVGDATVVVGATVVVVAVDVHTAHRVSPLPGIVTDAPSAYGVPVPAEEVSHLERVKPLLERVEPVLRVTVEPERPVVEDTDPVPPFALYVIVWLDAHIAKSMTGAVMVNVSPAT